MSDDLPETYGVDEVEILCKDPWWYFAYWEVTPAGFAAAQQQLGGDEDDELRLVLRVFTSSESGSPATAHPGRGRDGRDLRDIPLLARHGRRYLETPRQNALFRVAVGLLSPEGLFAPIAQSSLIRVPPQQPSSDTAVEWLRVLPPRSTGQKPERIVKAAAPQRPPERTLPWPSEAGGQDLPPADRPPQPGATATAGPSSLGSSRPLVLLAADASRRDGGRSP